MPEETTIPYLSFNVRTGHSPVTPARRLCLTDLN
jgi:hypothetical protein